jgi:sRNA-binding protein
MHAPTHDTIDSTTLIDDLLNPAITTAELCQIHRCTLDELDDLLASPRFSHALARVKRINTARAALAQGDAQAIATTRLADLLRDRPETPAHAETQRKAATTLLQTPASPVPTPTNPTPSQPVPTPSGTIDDTHSQGVHDMNTKAAAGIFTIAMGSGIIGAAWYMSTPSPAPTPEPMPSAEPTEPKQSGFDLFSFPSTPSPAKVFFESAEGMSIPPRSRNQVQGMISMMASLIDRMHEFDADGDGMLSDLEKMAMGYRLRKEFIAEHDLDGDGDMSGAEWRAFQKAMFEKTNEGQQLMAQFDLDGDGVLNEEEQAAFDAHQQQLEEQRRAEEQQRMDTNNDGEVDDEERRTARRQERDFWRNQMRTAENNFDYDGDGELNIEETADAWEAWTEYQEVDTFITNYDTDGDRSMGPADYEAFLSAFDRRDDEADVNNDGKINVSDINAFRDLVIRSRNVS